MWCFPFFNGCKYCAQYWHILNSINNPDSSDTDTTSLLGTATKEEKAVRETVYLNPVIIYLFKGIPLEEPKCVQITRLMCICLTPTWTFPEDDLGIHTSADLLAASSLYLLFSFYRQNIFLKNLKNQWNNWKAKHSCIKRMVLEQEYFSVIMGRGVSGDFPQPSCRTGKGSQHWRNRP